MDHDKTVMSVVKKILTSGHKNIKAHHVNGYDTPDEILGRDGQNYIPDITSRFTFSNYIFEIETEDEIESDHTRKQWLAFGNKAEFTDIFVIIVPEGCMQKAENVVHAIGLDFVTVWEIEDFLDNDSSIF